jgi:hypothetical protein
MFCPKCGTANTNDSQSCFLCKAEFGALPAEQAQNNIVPPPQSVAPQPQTVATPLTKDEKKREEIRKRIEYITNQLEATSHPTMQAKYNKQLADLNKKLNYITNCINNSALQKANSQEQYMQRIRNSFEVNGKVTLFQCNFPEKDLPALGYNIAKKISVTNNFNIYIDTDHKCIMQAEGLYNTKRVKLIDYSALVGFELVEDGCTITSTTTKTKTKGKGLATAAGALAFGIPGAIIGASGKRHSTSTSSAVSSQVCNSLSVILYLDDFQTPRVEIDFIKSQQYKSSTIYKLCNEAANELMASLNYLQNHQ